MEQPQRHRNRLLAGLIALALALVLIAATSGTAFAGVNSSPGSKACGSGKHYQSVVLTTSR
jgi:hypothetical protein